jgi:hypothetical protein
MARLMVIRGAREDPANGLGLRVVRALSSRGVDVAMAQLPDAGNDGGEQNGIASVPHVLDAVASSDLRVVADLSALDCLPEPKPFAELAFEELLARSERPVQASLAVLRWSGVRLQGTGGVHVVAMPISSLEGTPGRVAEAAAAEAIRCLVKSAARIFGPHGVRVHAIVVDEAVVAPDGTRPAPAARPGFAPAALPHDRIDEEAVADAISWLSAIEGRHTTGTTVVLDGGRFLLP